MNVHIISMILSWQCGLVCLMNVLCFKMLNVLLVRPILLHAILLYFTLKPCIIKGRSKALSDDLLALYFFYNKLDIIK